MAKISIINPRFEISFWGLEHCMPLFGKKANRNFFALLARFGTTDRDGLFAAGYSFSAPATFQSSPLLFVHCALNIFRSRLGVSASHDCLLTRAVVSTISLRSGSPVWSRASFGRGTNLR